MIDRSRPRWLLAALVVASVAWGAHYVHRTSFVEDGERVFTLWDDAMISMQYGRNLREGAGLVWSAGGERVQGFSNPGVTLAMAALHLLPLRATRMALAVQGLALGLWVATLVGVHGLTRRLFGPTAPAGAAALATALCAPLAIWSLQGSDVPFVTLWLVLAVAAVASDPPRPVRLCALLALGPWLRLDALLYVPLLLAAAAARGVERRRLAAGVLAPLLAVGALLGFGWLYYGDPLPNTWYLKATGSPRRLVLLSGAGELLAWLPWLLLPVALAGIAVWRRRHDARVVLVAALFLAGQAYNTWVGGDFVFGYGSRFAVPGLPFLLVLAVVGADDLLARVAATARPARRAAALLLAGCALGIVASPPLATREWLDPRADTLLRAQNRDNYRFARYLARHTDPSLTLGAHWGGVPPYFSGRPSIDVLGKSDRHIARLVVPRFLPGHSKWDWDYVLHERRPDVLRAPSRGLGRRPDFRRAYWKVETRDGLTFFLRRDAIAKLHDADVVLTDLTANRRLRPGALQSPR